MSFGVASLGSTLKDSLMQEVATSMLSRSSGVRVPSSREVLRKEIMERARRCLVVAILWNGCWVLGKVGVGEGRLG